VEYLPFVYISTAVIIPIIGVGYDRLCGWLALARLLMLTLGGLYDARTITRARRWRTARRSSALSRSRHSIRCSHKNTVR
jgi:hypothetical protein